MPIVDKPIYAGRTPLYSDFVVTQTGPMELTISSGEFQITGQAKILPVKDIPTEFLSSGDAEECDAENGEQMARVWLKYADNKKNRQGWCVGQCIDKSKLRSIDSETIISITSDPSQSKIYQIDLRSPSDTEMLIHEKSMVSETQSALPVTPDLTHTLIFPFTVPAGTTDLTDIPIEVFKVLPGREPKPKAWEK